MTPVGPTQTRTIMSSPGRGSRLLQRNIILPVGRISIFQASEKTTNHSCARHTAQITSAWLSSSGSTIRGTCFGSIRISRLLPLDPSVHSLDLDDRDQVNPGGPLSV